MFAALSPTIARARVAGVPMRALAASVCDTSWTGGDGDWSQGFHWTGGVPDSTKNACLPAVSYTVSIAGESAQAKTLQIGTGATLSLQIIGCGAANALLTLSGDLSNDGTVDLSNPGDACGGVAQVVVPSGSSLTNNGTIQTSGCCRGERKLSGNVVNYGTVRVSHNQYCCDPPTMTLDGGVFDNHGTVQVDAHRLSVVDSTVIAELGGTIDLGGTAIYCQNGGSTLAD